MIDRLELLTNRYNEINEELLKPEVLSDFNKQKKLSKEKGGIEEAVNKYAEYKHLVSEIESLKELVMDPEMHEIASIELDEKKDKLASLTKEIEILLLPKDENDGKDIIMEIRGAAGGDEANIFAGDLFRMYSKYAEKVGWKLEATHAVEGDSGGFSTIECSIKGDNVYSKLKFESGVHRVQRVPETETAGRIHTSTATVLVMPEVEDVDIEIKPEDVRVDVYRSSGKGGQGVNTTDSAVRVTHIPTGIVVTCQNERSQIKNKEIALKVLKSKLLELKIQQEQEQIRKLKGEQMDIGFGSQIRSYVFCPYTLVKDHRTDYETGNIQAVMDGEIDEFIKAYLKMNARG